jgi:hypothetical protein
MKYKLRIYLNVLADLIRYLEDKPEIVEDFIQNNVSFCDKEMVRDLFNQY